MKNCLTRRPGAEAGMSLVEVLITMMLLAVVSTLVVGAVVQTQRTVTHNDDENKGLQDAKMILDRLGRDVRESRGVVCDGGLADPTDAASADPYCKAHLQLWVDSNSDYAKEDSEVITWRLQRNPDGDHFDVWRTVGTGATPLSRKREASSLIVQIAFTYDAVDAAGNPAFSKVQQVNMNMKYDAIIGRGTSVRYVAFGARLRNKGA